MKGKILASVVVLALACASLALAAPPAGKGKPANPGSNGKGNGKSQSAPTAGATKGKKPTTGPGCRPAVSVILKGTLVVPPGAGTSFTMTATSGNAFGRAYVAGAQPVTVLVTPTTRVNRQGVKLASALLAGDWVLVQARVCKADLAGGAVPPLTASKIVAKPGAVTVVPPAGTTTEPTASVTTG